MCRPGTVKAKIWETRGYGMSLKIPIICDNNEKQLRIDFSAMDLPVIEVTRPANVTENARQVLEARYLVRNAQGELSRDAR